MLIGFYKLGEGLSGTGGAGALAQAQWILSAKKDLPHTGSLVNPQEPFEAWRRSISPLSRLAEKQTAVTEEGRGVRYAWRHAPGDFCPIKIFLNAKGKDFKQGG